MKRLLMECIGTFFFLLPVALGLNPIAIACMFMAWLYIGAHISGAHYNPMVSLAHAMRGSISYELMGRYMVAQIIGGFLAFAAASHLGYAAFPQPSPALTLFQSFIIEALLAFVLAFVILVVTTYEKYRGNQVFGFAIGFTLPALLAIGTPTTGGIFNPAVSIGSALFGLVSGMQTLDLTQLIMYVGGALLGGTLASLAFYHFMQKN